jgi:glucosyl-dolichyl phosphate glucuronosyltransferase
MTPRVSVVICSYNRASLLRRALESVREQRCARGAFEVIVVDNNSSDETPAVIREAGASMPLTHLREARQGLSFARNRGVAISRGDIVAFTDDDVRVAPDWIETLLRVAENHPDAAWFGGRVLAIWPRTPPSWLDRASWAPLALLDYGDRPLTLGGAERRVAIGANLAVRRHVLTGAGWFRADLQRVEDGVGSTEDHELQDRLAARGLVGVYDPALTVYSPVDPGRMTRRYYRRWHAGHGRFFARMRDPEFERSTRGHPLGVPAHAYRALLAAPVRWALAWLAAQPAAAFRHELEARFLAAYIGERINDYRSARHARVQRRMPA